ncbi:hypothetical protein [Sphingomonas sp.]|uniref:hypothetical protein n=1 Tax=Sphingomonas sp. TaxID=28214 RepID=UPI0035C86B98
MLSPACTTTPDIVLLVGSGVGEGAGVGVGVGVGVGEGEGVGDGALLGAGAGGIGATPPVIAADTAPGVDPVSSPQPARPSASPPTTTRRQPARHCRDIVIPGLQRRSCYNSTRAM